ncbi:YibE/F family protein [Occultella aeris]|uniref:YibE/F-like protein n=1 Tax=Occultella aeris TaxID=2761496 RepID=A0A7M4DQP8_9MICO|nr:YibE/F family protein [Occultella aeris]VZO39792.1 YibE/F-like protein [Occultella aeris]
MSHQHTELDPDRDLGVLGARRARRILAACVLPLLIATIVGLIALWPGGDTPIGSLENPVEGPNFTTATVVEVTGVIGEEVRAELHDGTGRIVPVQVPPEIVESGIEVGSQMRVFFTASALGSGSPYVFVDFVRDVPLIILGIVYALVVLAVARLRGFMAIVGLLASLGVVGVFLIPALMGGGPPLLVTLVGTSAMMFFAVYLAHGISIRTTTALLGTFIGLAATTALAAWATGAASLTGANSDSSLVLSSVLPGVNLRDILLCGIVIAGLGALNDVTITQASAVWELRAASPNAPLRQVFGRAMRIGRDHIASTVYTLAFAYVGTALPVLMIVMLYDRSLGSTLTAGEIAEEVVRTLVSSIGLVLAIPATTAIATLLVASSRARDRFAVLATPDGVGAVPAELADGGGAVRGTTSDGGGAGRETTSDGGGAVRERRRDRGGTAGAHRAEPTGNDGAAAGPPGPDAVDR